jgi:glucosylceramidase
MELPAVSEAAFIADFLSPALAAAGLRTHVFGLDGVGVSYAQTLETAAGGQLAGIAWHCYGGMNELSVFHALHPTVPEIVSECSPGIIPYSTAEVLIDATRNWASSMALWNLALNPVGGPVQPPDSGCPHCTGVITVDEHTHSFSYTSSYFQLGQFSKFVKPGAVRIASNTFASEFHAAPAPHAHGYGITTGLEDVAFENPDGQLVLIAYDHASVSEQFTVSWQGDSFSYTLPAGATVTFTWR